MPARIYGVKPETGGHVEVLLLNNTHGDELVAQVLAFFEIS